MGRPKTLFFLAALTAAAAVLYGAAAFCAGREDTGFYKLAEEEEIVTIDLDNTYGSLKLWRDGTDTWMVREGAGEAVYTAGEEKMNLLLASLKDMEISRLLEEEKPEYGFYSAGARLAFSTSQGKQYSFMVGNETMTRSHVYLKDGSTGRIGITELGSVAQLGGGLSAFRNREIFHVDMEHITAITRQKPGEETLSLVLEDGEWRMTAPYEAPAREIEIKEQLAAMKDWNLCAFGDRAVYTEEQMGFTGKGEILTLTDHTGKSQTLEIGTPVQAMLPVRSGGKDDILLLYADEVDTSILAGDKLLFFAPLRASIDDVERSVLTVGNTSLDFDTDSANNLFKCNGYPVDSEAFYSFYISYMALTASGGGGNAPQKNAGELAALQTFFKDGTSTQLRLLERDKATCHMVVNNSYSGFYISNEKLITLISKLERLGNY